MGQLVRRAVQPLAATENEDQLPEKKHSGGGIFVTSQVALGIEPKLFLSWAVLPSHWAKGYTLLVFHSMSGFSPEKYPEDLNKHGRLIIETVQDDWREERPEEGSHYYTFVLHKRGFLPLWEKVAVLRFSETIPSARIAIGRIRNKLELEEMRRRHEIDEIEHEAKVNEAQVRRLRSREQLASAEQPKAAERNVDRIVSDEMRGIEAVVEALLAKHQKIAELKRDPRFKKLSRAEKQAVIDRIETRLDAGEISARREMNDA
jgi:hypothetical protein